FLALATAHLNLSTFKIDTLHPQPQGIHETQPRAIHQRRLQIRRTIKPRQNLLYLRLREHYRSPFSLLGSFDPSDVRQVFLEDIPIEKKQRTESHGLG